MSTPDPSETEAPPRKSKRGLLIGLVLACLAGGGGFYAVYSGMILPAQDQDHAADQAAAAHDAVEPLPEVAFVPTGAIVVPVGDGATGRFLHFAGVIEVAKEHEPDVTHLLPRITDVLNTYLRAVEASDLDRKTALVRLRAQMLRRVQIVLGDGRARDLLITEFVIN